MVRKTVLVLVLICVVFILFYVKENKGLSQSELAELLGIDLDVVQNRHNIGGDVIKDTNKYHVYRTYVPSFFKIESNKRAYQFAMPCYLFLYKDAQKRPGVLIVPGNGPGIASTTGLMSDYEDKSALRLAEAGFNVLTCDNIGLARYELKIAGEKIETITGQNEIEGAILDAKVVLPPESLVRLFDRKSFIGMLVQDQLQALNVLKAIPTVDKIGVGGASMGGMIAMYLAAFDKDVTSVISMGFFNEFDLLPPFNSHWDWYKFPGIDDVKMYDTVSLIAPRNLLVVNGERDASQSIDESKKLFNAVKKKYASIGAENNVHLYIHDGGHIWKNDVAIDFFSKTLKN